jgi:tetratricopeptide (TPR) repeat protein
MVAAVITFSLVERKKYTNDALFENFYTAPDPKEVEGEEAVPPDFANGLVKYYDTNYVEAIQYFARVPRNSDRYWEAYDYVADAYYHIDKIDQSILVYDKMRKEADTRHRELAEWKYALFVLIESGDKKEAMDQLGRILEDPEHRHFNEAGDLYTKLRSPIRLLASY